MIKTARRAACWLLPVILAGCISPNPPVNVVPDMDFQMKFRAQSTNAFYADSAAMRMPPPGTVAWGTLEEDDAFYRGISADSQWVEKIPVMVDADLLARGRDRFNIFCSPCHDRAGTGQGIVAKRGIVPPPTFHQARIRNFRDGEFFNVITNGVRSMPPYRKQTAPADRWAIVSYVRALQKSRLGGP